MKKVICITLVLMFVSLNVNAQVEDVGWITFGGNMIFFGKDAHIKTDESAYGFNFGLGAGSTHSAYFDLGFSLTFISSFKGELYDKDQNEWNEFKPFYTFWTGGYQYKPKIAGRFKPFLGGGLSYVHFEAKEIILDLGLKRLTLSPNIGFDLYYDDDRAIRFEARYYTASALKMTQLSLIFKNDRKL